MTKEDELREKINTFMVKMDKMESRVKDMETVTSTIPKLVAKLEKVEHRVETAEKSMGITPPPVALSVPPAPPPVKAFVGGMSIGLLVIGIIVAAWLLGFF